MWDELQRQAIFFTYYFSVQFEQIVWYWLAGMIIGSAIAVFLKKA